MKNATAWLLLTAYLCASCSGVLPMAMDLVAHVFWHKAHIEHVHLGKKGHDHVSVEMSQLLDSSHNQDAHFSEMSGGKAKLSTHYGALAVIKTSKVDDWSITPFPSLSFKLPTGAKPSVFLPPEKPLFPSVLLR